MRKLTKFWISFMILTLLVPYITPTVHADAVYEVIVTLGEDLTDAQQADLLEEMGVSSIDEQAIIYVTNEEEHNYLGDVIPAAQIGTRAISSAKITMQDENSGIMVTTENITYISGSMYANALATAGVTGAEIYVTAPFAVSGTGALTGILKAYEQNTGEVIDEDLKKAANEEMVLTAELAEDDEVSEDEAVDFMNRIKEEIEAQQPQTPEELRELIRRLAEEMGIDLTDAQLDQLVDLFNRLRNLNIDWTRVTQTLSETRDWLRDFRDSEEGQGFLRDIGNFFRTVWDWLVSLFN